MIRPFIVSAFCWLFCGTTALAHRIDEVVERRLVVLTDHDANATYHIIGFTDAAAHFRDVFSRHWKHHPDIRYATLEEMPEILQETPGNRLAVVMLNQMLDKRPSMDRWENFPVLGVYPGEQFEDMSKVNNLMVPLTCYVFPENTPLFTEFIMAVKFMNDHVACEVKKVGCDMDDEIEVKHKLLGQQKLVVLNWYAGTDEEQAAALRFFGPNTQFVDPPGFWAIYNGPTHTEHSFLVMASNKYGKITTTYFIADMSDASLMAKHVPGGWHYISGSRRPETKHLEKIGRACVR